LTSESAISAAVAASVAEAISAADAADHQAGRPDSESGAAQIFHRAFKK
jgi:hypothetical protein